jgi:hypothetical protein
MVNSGRTRGIIWFSAAVIVLLDMVVYAAGRLVLMFKLRDRLGTNDLAERTLIVWTGGFVIIVIGALLSWAVWHALHLGHSRPSTRRIIGCSVFLGIGMTLVSTWVFWANSFLPLPRRFFPEFSASTGDWLALRNVVNTYEPEQWWLVPVFSAIFLACCFVGVALRAIYVRLFERQ